MIFIVCVSAGGPVADTIARRALRPCPDPRLTMGPDSICRRCIPGPPRVTAYIGSRMVTPVYCGDRSYCTDTGGCAAIDGHPLLGVRCADNITCGAYDLVCSHGKCVATRPNVTLATDPQPPVMLSLGRQVLKDIVVFFIVGVAFAAAVVCMEISKEA